MLAILPEPAFVKSMCWMRPGGGEYELDSRRPPPVPELMYSTFIPLEISI
jgi:hypothetical protein